MVTSAPTNQYDQEQNPPAIFHSRKLMKHFPDLSGAVYILEPVTMAVL